MILLIILLVVLLMIKRYRPKDALAVLVVAAVHQRLRQKHREAVELREGLDNRALHIEQQRYIGMCSRISHGCTIILKLSVALERARQPQPVPLSTSVIT